MIQKSLPIPEAVDIPLDWNTGLNEQTPSEQLEKAWLETWQEWRLLLTQEAWNKHDPRLQWVHKRLGLIYALRMRHSAEQYIVLARQGDIPCNFTLNSEDDPFRDVRDVL